MWHFVHIWLYFMSFTFWVCIYPDWERCVAEIKETKNNVFLSLTHFNRTQRRCQESCWSEILTAADDAELIFSSLDIQLASSSGQIVELHHVLYIWHWLGFCYRLDWFWRHWCCLDLDSEVMRMWQRLQIKWTQTAGLTRENEQLLLSSCFSTHEGGKCL